MTESLAQQTAYLFHIHDDIAAPTITMSNTIEIITLIINAIDLLIVIMQVCLPWARGARCDDNIDQGRRINEAEREMGRMHR